MLNEASRFRCTGNCSSLASSGGGGSERHCNLNITTRRFCFFFKISTLRTEPWDFAANFDLTKLQWVEDDVFCFSANNRYELAQQLQPQSAEDALGGAAVAHEVQVEIEGESLPQPPAATAEQQSMLGLSEAEVVNGSQTVTLEAPLTDQTLVQGEGEWQKNHKSSVKEYFCRQVKDNQMAGWLDGCTFWP